MTNAQRSERRVGKPGIRRVTRRVRNKSWVARARGGPWLHVIDVVDRVPACAQSYNRQAMRFIVWGFKAAQSYFDWRDVAYKTSTP